MGARVAELPAAQRERIVLRQAALWSSKGQVAFDGTGQVGSAIHAQGRQLVDTDTLASLESLPSPLLVKLDVEGAERPVLDAGMDFIRHRRPLLALSVYHRPDDLLDLYELLDAQRLGYRFHLRCHGGDGSDLTLYGVAGDTACTARATAATSAAVM
jgi:hypothetical protein